MSGSRQEISGDETRACVSEIWPYDVTGDEREMDEAGARTGCEATRVEAKDHVWGETGIDPRKKCMKNDEIADLSTRILTNHWWSVAFRYCAATLLRFLSEESVSLRNGL